MFSFFLLANSDDSCTVISVPGVSDTIAAGGKGTRTSIADLMGISYTTDFHAAIAEGHYDIMDYVWGSIGFAVPFVIIFVLFAFFFCITPCALCCCCKPKRHKKPTLIKSIVLFFALVFNLLSIIFLLIATSNFLNALDNVKTIPDKLTDTVKTITGIVRTTIDSTFDIIDETVDEVRTDVTNYIAYLDIDGDAAVKKAQGAKTAAEQYHIIYQKDNTYYNTMKDIVTLLGPNDPLFEDTAILLEGPHETTKLFYELTDTVAGQDTTITNTITSAKKLIANNFDDVEKEIKNYREGEDSPVAEVYNSLDDLDSSVGDTSFDDILDIMDLAAGFIKPICIGVTVFYAVVIIAYSVLFWFGRCCTRCMFNFFWLWFFLLSFLIIIPTAVFAALFFVFYDMCPVLEKSAASILGDSMGEFFTEQNFVDILTCPASLDDRRLFGIADLNESLFDYSTIGDEIRDTIDDAMGESPFESDIIDELDKYREMNIGDLDEDMLFPNYQATFKALKAHSDGDVRTKAAEALGYITANTETRSSVQTALQEVIEFGTSITPKTDKVFEDITKTTKTLPELVVSNFEAGVDSLTCDIVSCLYAPIKNTICEHFLSGLSWWIMGGYFAIIGMFVMSIAIFVRRPDLGTRQVEVEDKEMDDIDDNVEQPGPDSRNIQHIQPSVVSVTNQQPAASYIPPPAPVHDPVPPQQPIYNPPPPASDPAPPPPAPVYDPPPPVYDPPAPPPQEEKPRPPAQLPPLVSNTPYQNQNGEPVFDDRKGFNDEKPPEKRPVIVVPQKKVVVPPQGSNAYSETPDSIQLKRTHLSNNVLPDPVHTEEPEYPTESKITFDDLEKKRKN